ncbi:hypothetical protein MLD38_021954 [Melastoma candidum]|uniref:Uncharacterized protein n=1 Tax=Melastoma candidum TaxID=119954 RepID=A0ACB9QHQ7_9MYRT|nr:hypothetical protein MLD38_021954 [Melastoma candidum]
MDVTEVTMIHHVCFVLFGLWFLSKLSLSNGVVYLVCLVYLFLVHERHIMRMRQRIRFEEKRESNQRRVLTDSETVRWLNHAVERIWPVCLEQIVSQRMLLPIVPWFLEKYKPWTAKNALVQHLYLGRNPPIFTDMRVLRQNCNDDHLVLELGMNFLTADDMSAILAVQLRKRLGFGMWTKLHLTGMHIEGKVLIGVKFVREWPFIGRLRLCFAEPPYFQMTVKPLFTHGVDVTEVPGIAGWLDNLLSIAFEQTLVEPNMLVVDLEKFVAPQKGSWFSVDVKEPVAYARVEVIEAVDMKPSDLNGLADPYVKGQMGPYRFKTKIKRKTLTPRWMEEFKIPIVTWESPNVLTLDVHDKDPFVDDYLGKCLVNLNDLKDGQRHDMWVALQDIKMGRLHLAITVLEDSEAQPRGESLYEEKIKDTTAILKDKRRLEYGFIPGVEVSQTWKPRKGKSRRADTEIRGEHDGEARKRENGDAVEKQSRIPVQHGLSRIFQRTPRKDDQQCCGEVDGVVLPSPHANLRSISSERVAVNLVVEGDALPDQKVTKEGSSSREESGSDSPKKGKKREKAKRIFKHADRTIKQVLSGKGLRGWRDSSSLEREKNGSSQSDSSKSESPPTGESIVITSMTVTSGDTGNSHFPDVKAAVPENSGSNVSRSSGRETEGDDNPGERIITSVIPEEEEDDQLNGENPKT